MSIVTSDSENSVTAKALSTARQRIVILGAAGRDFHTFNVCCRDDPSIEVVGFTAAQIPGIAERRYPPSLSGPLYPQGIAIYPEKDLESLIRGENVQQVIFAYSDVSHTNVMHLASRVLACGADFKLIGPERRSLNDWPFYRSDLEIVLLDPHRAGHELLYHPGETNLRRAKVLIINKMDSAPVGGVQEVMRNAAAVNPHAAVIQARSRITVDCPELIQGKRVLVIEDGPTLTHGEMAYGSGCVAAHRYGAAELVDPRPVARGALPDVFARYPHIGPALPAMGYSPAQLDDLAATIAAVDCDAVVIATPVDLGRLISIDKPSCRVRTELEEIGHPDLMHTVYDFLRAHSAKLPAIEH
ncbi:MAG TPA: hypothetical protein VGD41_09475 [Pyrinomonadaceae bacterium]